MTWFFHYFWLTLILCVNSFIIRPNGQIESTRSFDYEEQNLYTFYVNATNDNRVTFQLVTVNINDLQDSDPLFEERDYTYSVFENDPNVVFARIPVHVILLHFKVYW